MPTFRLVGRDILAATLLTLAAGLFIVLAWNGAGPEPQRAGKAEEPRSTLSQNSGR